jgi:hypothetical protein
VVGAQSILISQHTTAICQLPAVDIFYLRDGAPGAPPVMVQGAPNDAEPLLVDLYETVVILLDPFNDPMESSLNNLP